MSSHPNQERLALFASGDLGRLTRWTVERHLHRCADCRRDVSDFSELRSELSQSLELPELRWSQLGPEMKANIRLGLAAGECVGPRPASHLVLSPRVLAACASLLLLVAASLLLERPMPSVNEARHVQEGAILEASGSGIQVKEGGQALMLLNSRAHDVNVMASGGTMRARYVDADTGNVTINNVYVQ